MARRRAQSPGAAPAAPKGKKLDLIGRCISRIQRSSPRNFENGQIQVMRMNSSRMFSSVKHVIRSGLDPFDDIVGPIPIGRVMEVYGPEASGKTAFVKKVCKQAFLKDLWIYNPDGSLSKIEDDTEVVVCYFDNEHSIESSNNEIIIDGVKIDGILTECDVIEDLWKTVDNVLDEVKLSAKNEEEKRKKAEKDGKTYKPKKFLTVFIVDTIASTSSIEEYTKDWGEEDYPRMPKKLKEGFRRMVRRIGNENVIFIASNQANETFGNKSRYIAPDKKFNSPGGKALKFFASTRVLFEQLPVKFVLDEEYQFQQGYVISFISTKNRLKKPLREGRLILLFDSAPNIYGDISPSGLNNEYSILETLLYLKFVQFEDDKFLRFHFRKFEIPMTTFNDLEDDEDPRMPSRADWVAFYAAHKADIDMMWRAAIDYIHKDRCLTNVRAIEDKSTGEEEGEQNETGSDGSPVQNDTEPATCESVSDAPAIPLIPRTGAVLSIPNEP